MPQPTTELESRKMLDPTRLRWFVYACIIAVSSAVTLGRIVSAGTLQSANDRSRWSTVWALVERGTYVIDEIDANPRWTTIDKVRHEGHFYSSKPPLLATLVAGVYWGAKRVTGWNLIHDTDAVTDLILVLINLVPMAVVLFVLASMLERYAQRDSTRYFVLLTAAFGTFLTTLNNHTPAAIGLVFVLDSALRIVADGSRRPVWFAICGFFSAFVCTNEMPAAMLGIAMFGLLFAKSPKLTMFYFVPAAVVPLAAFFETNYIATGGWKPFYTYYGTEKYRYVHDGMPSYWMSPRGLDANEESPLSYFFNCTFGHHGIVSLTPVFLLTVATWAMLPRLRRSPLFPFLTLGLALTIVVLSFYLTRTANYNYGGNTAGLRWMFWLIPFWLVGLIPALDAWGASRRFRAIVVVLLAASTFSAFYAFENPWQQPWLYRLAKSQGYLPDARRQPFDPPLRTWFRGLPSTMGFAEDAWLELEGPEADGRTVTLRLSEDPLASEGHREITFGTDSVMTVVPIDVAAFAAGAPPEEFVWQPPEGLSEETRSEVFTTLRGLPVDRRYHPGPSRYIKTPLREAAFYCEHAASQVLFQPPNATRPSLYRTDVWLSAEVPFGVVLLKNTVSDPDTGAIISARTLQVVDASEVKESPVP